MLLLRHNSSLPDLDASSIRLRSSSYPSYNTIPSKHFTSSPSEEILSNYVHTTPPSQPPLSMYSSSQDQRDNSLVDPWLPAPASAGVSQPADLTSPLSRTPSPGLLIHLLIQLVPVPPSMIPASHPLPSHFQRKLFCPAIIFPSAASFTQSASF
jgi:hypothetical protein